MISNRVAWTDGKAPMAVPRSNVPKSLDAAIYWAKESMGGPLENLRLSRAHASVNSLIGFLDDDPQVAAAVRAGRLIAKARDLAEEGATNVALLEEVRTLINAIEMPVAPVATAATSPTEAVATSPGEAA